MDRSKWARYCAYVGQQDQTTLLQMRSDLLKCVNLIDAHVNSRDLRGDRLLVPWALFAALILAAVGGVVWL